VKWINFFLAVLFFLLFILSSKAQTGSDKIPLQEFLKTTEKRFNITFTYADENVQKVYIKPPRNTMSLDETLEFLQKNTPLEFKKIDSQFISISKIQQENIICGYVLDAESGEGISGASILSNGNHTVTSHDGYFEMEIPDENGSMTIQSMGFLPVKRNAKTLIGKPCTTLRLRPKTIELQEVVIQNYLTKGINKEITGSFEIQPDELGILPGLIEQDVLETVQALPGILSAQEKVADINVRAGTNDQNLVLWDGIRMYQNGHFFGLISAFNPYLTDHVILSKNGTSAALDEGVSSTIEILSNDKVIEKFSGGAGLNFINGDVFFKIPVTRKLSVQASARRSLADIIKTPTYSMYYDRAFRNTEVINVTAIDEDEKIDNDESFIFHDANVKLIYDPTPKDKLRINLINFSNNLEFEENAAINDTSVFKTSSLSQNNIAFGLTYSRQWNEHMKTHILGYYTRYDLRAVNQDVSNEQRLIQENEVIEDGLKADISIAVKNSALLTCGYQFTEVGIGNLQDVNNPVFYQYIKKVLRTHAVFTEAEVNSRSNRTNLRIGLRANYFEKFNEISVEPRFSLNHRFYKNFSVELMGEIKTQTATQVINLQNDFLGVENRRWILANENDIPIVNSKQISTGLNFENQGFLISLDGYFKYVDGITTSSQGFQNQFQNQPRSSGSYQSYGIDVLVNQHIGNFSTWMSYSYSHNICSFPGLDTLDFPSNLDIPHAANLAASYQIKSLELSAGMKWRKGIPITTPIEGSEIENGGINYGTPNAKRLSDYLRLDFSIKYGIELRNKMRLFLGASIWNLTNRKNVVNQYYRLNDANELEIVKQNSLGLTPNVSVRLHF